MFVEYLVMGNQQLHLVTLFGTNITMTVSGVDLLYSNNQYWWSDVRVFESGKLDGVRLQATHDGTELSRIQFVPFFRVSDLPATINFPT